MLEFIKKWFATDEDRAQERMAQEEREKCMLLAQQAETGERWEEAASCYTQAGREDLAERMRQMIK
jgi:hypothetical protein